MTLHPDRRGGFATTRWTMVVAAGGPSDDRSRAALSELCALYWPPLYSFLRRRGHSRERAEDLTQGFFARILERKDIQSADPERGRFRSFLLTALKRYVVNEHEHDIAAKRGGPMGALAVDFDDAERKWASAIRSEDTPDRVFDRQWALLTVDRALESLRTEYRHSGHDAAADALLPYLTERGLPRYKEVAERIGTTENAVKQAVRRMRTRLGEVLREQIADTVLTPDEVDQELRELLRILAA